MTDKFNVLFKRHQPLPRASQPQLNSESCGEENVNFASLNFLEIPGGDFRPFRQFLLRKTFTHTFAAHIRPKHFHPRPFFLSERHGILNRILPSHLNDTLYREIYF